MNNFSYEYVISPGSSLQLFREMLRAEAEGRSYNLPPPSSVPPPSARSKSAAPSMANSKNASAKNLDEWDDWGDSNGNGAGAVSSFNVQDAL